MESIRFQFLKENLKCIKREFKIQKLKEETVKDYFSKLSQLVNQMRLYGEKIDNVKIVEKMLRSLKLKWKPLKNLVTINFIVLNF